MQAAAATPYVKAWLWSGIICITLMIVIGGITRLTGSGLSIVEWRLISGTLPPLNEQQWQEAFSAYKQFPEYQKVNAGFGLSEFKSIFWWEFIHRFLGRFLGFLFLLPFAYFLLRRQLSPALSLRMVLILGVGALQGLMGWLMVKSGLVDVPHVSHYRLAAHFSLALLLIGMLLWTLQDLKNTPALQISSQNPTKHKHLYRLSQGLLLALFLQIVLGAFVAGLKAGLYYNTFPLMGEGLVPRGAFAAAMNLLESGPTVQFLHRWWGFAVLALALLLTRQVSLLQGLAGLKKTMLSLLVVLLAQAGLGILTLLYQVPLALGVLHQLVAVILFGLAVLLVYKARPASRRVKPVSTPILS